VPAAQEAAGLSHVTVYGSSLQALPS